MYKEYKKCENYFKIDIFRFLKNNGFRLYSTLKFPFYGFEDRIYINNKFFSQNKIKLF